MKYTFGDFTVDLARRRLTLDTSEISLEPQVFAILEIFLGSQGVVVSRSELLTRVWGTKVVTEASLDSRIRSLRTALRDDGASQALIQTVRGVGFRFVPEVKQVASTVTNMVGEPPSRKTGLNESSPTHKPRVAVMPLSVTGGYAGPTPIGEAISHELTVSP